MFKEEGLVCYFPKIPKGMWPVDRTWLSYPGPIPDDLPEEFTEEDFDCEQDEDYVRRVERQVTTIQGWGNASTSNHHQEQ